MFKLEIRLGNAAMQTAEDVAEALRRLADKVEAADIESDRGRVMDLNGNRVGDWEITA
jgi:hypothetical protein